ncbi:peptidoglycan-binding domain-containing protein [Paracoccus ravus]|uniref:peptidoglycan-binding domain-containing protein n=1 Tax=Paracoccus ravus TaxID=2447760 RepID=UPI001ADACCCE|nr:peptidoglycan-binding domain-containing protein [Paracoccus ravus]
MRRFAFIFAAALPLLPALPAQAEDVLIRIEAKRGTEAARASAEGWSARFSNIVTFPLADGWVGVALGPLPRAEATIRLRELKSAGRIPGDSFLAPLPGQRLTPVAPAAGTPRADPPADRSAAAVGSPSTFPLGGAAGAQPEQNVTAAAEPVPETDPQPVKYFLRIESASDRAKAEELLAKRRETLPEVGLWALPNGRSAIALGPMDEATGKAWLAAFRRAEAIPRDALLSPQTEMGQPVMPGSDPELGPPPAEGAEPAAMPPLEDIQRALRWAGHYDGAIDGKDGPMTQAAIADEIVNLRTSPDTATAMQELIRRRETWRREMGLGELRDAHTGLALPAPMEKLEFDRAERALSIYGPKGGSGAALILFSQPGDQQEMLDLTGLVTALGWVPAPKRDVRRGSVTLDGRNETHISHAEARIRDGRVEGFVLIWPGVDPEEQRRLASEISDNLGRFAPTAAEIASQAPAETAATPEPLAEAMPGPAGAEETAASPIPAALPSAAP